MNRGAAPGLVALVLLAAFPIVAAGASLATVLDFPVTKVESSVFGREDVAALKRLLGLTVGRPVELERVDEGVREAFKKGVVQSLFVEAFPDGKGVRIELGGSKLRKLRKVTFRGVETEVLEDVRRHFNFKEGESADSRTFSQLRERLKEAYEAKGYYFAEVNITVSEEEGTNEADVEVAVELNRPTVVGKVTLSGVPPELAKQLSERITVRKGVPFRRTALEESIEIINRFLRANQYPTSRVEDNNAVFSADKLTVDVTLTIRLGERYLFLFGGNTVFDNRALRQMMTEEVLTQPDSLVRIVDLIEKRYRTAGYHFIKVKTSTRTDPVDRLQIVEFQIEEGPKVIIDELVFTGGTGDVPLESLFYEGAPGVLGRGIYWEAGVAEAMENLRRTVRARGHLGVNIGDPRVLFTEDRRGAKFLMETDVGTRTVVKEFDIKGVSAIPTAAVLEAVGVEPGAPVNRAALEEGRRRLLERLQSEGHLDAKFVDGDEWLALSQDRREATVSLHVDEGRQSTLGAIRIEGNRKTQPEVILREMRLNSGDKFDPMKVRKSEEDVALLGLFSRVEVIPSDTPGQPGKKDLTILVRETRPGVGEMGFGGVYEEPRLRLRTFLGVAYRNLGGLNQTVSARGQVSLPISKQKFIPFVEYSTTFGYRAPYIFNLPFIFSSQVGLDNFETSTVGPTLKTRARIEGKLERKLSRHLTGIYRLYRYERSKTERLDTLESNVESVGSTGPGVILDFRDDVFNPTRGSYHSLDVEFSHPSLLSSSNIGFVMALARNSFYVPLVAPFSFTAFFGLGYAQALSGLSIPTTRLTDDLSLGGQASVRGFELKSISPYRLTGVRPSQTAFYNARFELTSYLLSNISAAVFFDTGQIFPDLVGQTRRDGAGVGLRYKTPVGPVVIDVAQALRGGSSVRFYFTVGTI